MTGKAKIIAVCLVTLLALAFASCAPPIQQAQIQAEIDAARAAEAEFRQALVYCVLEPGVGHLLAASVELAAATVHGQNAVDLANVFYGTMVMGAAYDPLLGDDGATDRAGNIRVGRTGLGMTGVASPGWLASTKIHERTHRQQLARGDGDNLAYWTPCTALYHQTEIEAYQAELNAAGQTGLTAAERAEIQRRINDHQALLH